MIQREKLALYLLFLFFLVQNVQGQEETNLRIHGNLGLSSPSEQNLASGVWSGFGFSVPIKKKIHLSFNFGAWKSQASAKPGGLQDGSLSVSPFFVSLQYFLTSDWTINPFVFIGGGYIFASYRMEDLFTIPEITLSQKVENSPGGQLGAGIQLKMSKRIFLSVDASFFYSKASATTTIQDLNLGTKTENFSLILKAIIIQLGFKFLI
jgi:outer membrane protein W